MEERGSKILVVGKSFDISLYYYEISIVSLALCCVLLFMLFSPDIVMFLHKKHFEWKDVKKDKTDDWYSDK